MTGPRSDKGVSLLELVAVLAIFSLVSVMALQLLTGGIAARGRLAASGAEVPGVIAALTVLRRDLEGMQPVTGGGFRPGPDGLWLVRADGQGARTEVVWQVDEAGRLTRQVQDVARQGGAVIMAEGVSAWRVQTAAAGGRWQRAGGAGADLPRGIAVSLTHAALGDLRVVATR